MNRRVSRNRSLWFSLFFAAVSSICAAAAEGATLNAANNGLDSPTCGAAASPCRSISQAIANASADDVCNSGGGSTTTTAPFSATEIPVNTFPLF